MDSPFTYSVFTKAWKMPLPELAKHVSNLGFDGVELPVRPGYQVTPENVQEDLPKAAEIMADHGLKIFSVAAPTDKVTIAACAKSGIPLIRICIGIESNAYLAGEARYQNECDALVPLLDKYHVTIGVQNHCGKCVANAMQLLSFLKGYNSKHIAAVWDVAHNALNGEEPEHAIDILWSHLRMVNLKNAFWRQRNGPEAEYAQWHEYWTTGRNGLASWPRVAAELKRREWSGVLCLSAEYNDHGSVNRLIADDLAFAKSLFD
jgi:sugar phosphate isomerase/epimerase